MVFDTKPLSDLLRAGTATAHEQAENSEGAKWLARGELDKDEYVRLLIMLWCVYELVQFQAAELFISPGC